MCGIAGAVTAARGLLPEARLLSARDSFTHRGPDDAGVYIGEHVALASRRLAILDLSACGRMPMATLDGRYRIVYNGEIYNFAELRSEMEGRGHRFVSRTDTEVLLAMYATHGPAMLPRLNGMFAFAIWDHEERTLFLARDRLGIKPLYYVERDGYLYFASEQKAFLEFGLELDFDPGALEELVCFRYVAGEKTPYRDVRRLLPGHYLRWKDGEISIQRWWCLADRAAAVKGELPEDAAAWYRETFDSSVQYRRISDVPVGVLLSGGLDSSSIASALAMQSGGGHSFTVRFREKDWDEGPLARLVSQRYGMQGHELYVDDGQLLESLREASWLNDEPLAHANSVHLLAISKLAKERVTVLLSGEGGDETLGGYGRYRILRQPLLLRLGREIPQSVVRWTGIRRMQKLARMLELSPTGGPVIFNACEVLPTELRALGFPLKSEYAYRRRMYGEARRLYQGEPVRQAMYLDQHTYLCSVLDRNDRMTMGASIECRVPFLDYRLVEGTAALTTAQLLGGRGSKPLLRRALGARLPREILAHRKWGFGVPWARYLRLLPDFREIVQSLPKTAPIQGAFDARRLRSTIDEFFSSDYLHDPLILQLVMIVIWYQECLERRSAPVIAAARNFGA